MRQSFFFFLCVKKCEKNYQHIHSNCTKDLHHLIGWYLLKIQINRMDRDTFVSTASSYFRTNPNANDWVSCHKTNVALLRPALCVYWARTPTLKKLDRTIICDLRRLKSGIAARKVIFSSLENDNWIQFSRFGDEGR